MTAKPMEIETVARLTAIHRPADHPQSRHEGTAREAAELFEYLCPNSTAPQIDRSHDGIAIAAQNPRLALNLAQLSRFMALELQWCRRPDLRELAIQAVNAHFGCEYSFNSRIRAAEAAGIGIDLQRALPQWRLNALFNAEQKLVIEYTLAVVGGKVPDDLFARVVASFGEKGTVEFTAVAGFWAFWAMFLNATRPGA